MRRLPSPLGGLGGPFGTRREPAPQSAAIFLESPTIAEAFDTWLLVGGAEMVTVAQMPRCDQPVGVGGNETITIEG
jgi:hypothetical protein